MSIFKDSRRVWLTMVTLLLTATGLFSARSRNISRPRHRSLKSPACRHDVMDEMSAVAAAEVMRPGRLQRSPTAEAGAELQFNHIHIDPYTGCLQI